MDKELEKIKNVLHSIKQTFIGKDEVIDLLGVALVARENAFLFGPPGTAKSAIVKALSKSVIGGKNFEYLLTRYTEPNEIFGPFDIKKLREGELVTNIEGMMPEASFVFLDEIFNANSAILNSLLMALNEKVVRRGKETLKLPSLMFVGASNALPEDETLNALLDRFLIRVKCDYVNPELLEQVLLSGRKYEKSENNTLQEGILADEIIELQSVCRHVDMQGVLKEYIDLIRALRNVGIKVSDRRAVKYQNIVAASAIIAGRLEAQLSDLWVLKYIWDTEDQIEIIAGIVNSYVERESKKSKTHPQAFSNSIPDSEKIMHDIEKLKEQVATGSLSGESLNLTKDKLRYIQSQSKWISKEEHKNHIQKEIDDLWVKLLETV